MTVGTEGLVRSPSLVIKANSPSTFIPNYEFLSQSHVWDGDSGEEQNHATTRKSHLT